MCICFISVVKKDFKIYGKMNILNFDWISGYVCDYGLLVVSMLIFEILWYVDVLLMFILLWNFVYYL